MLPLNFLEILQPSYTFWYFACTSRRVLYDYFEHLGYLNSVGTLLELIALLELREECLCYFDVVVVHTYYVEERGLGELVQVVPSHKKALTLKA